MTTAEVQHRPVRQDIASLSDVIGHTELPLGCIKHPLRLLVNREPDFAILAERHLALLVTDREPPLAIISFIAHDLLAPGNVLGLLGKTASALLGAHTVALLDIAGFGLACRIVVTLGAFFLRVLDEVCCAIDKVTVFEPWVHLLDVVAQLPLLAVTIREGTFQLPR